MILFIRDKTEAERKKQEELEKKKRRRFKPKYNPQANRNNSKPSGDLNIPSEIIDEIVDELT